MNGENGDDEPQSLIEELSARAGISAAAGSAVLGAWCLVSCRLHRVLGIETFCALMVDLAQKIETGCRERGEWDAERARSAQERISVTNADARQAVAH